MKRLPLALLPALLILGALFIKGSMCSPQQEQDPVVSCPEPPSYESLEVTDSWSDVPCASELDVKINKLDGNLDRVYLAYRAGSSTGYSDALPYSGKKYNRAAMYFPGQKAFIFVESCSETTCEVICQPRVVTDAS